MNRYLLKRRLGARKRELRQELKNKRSLARHRLKNLNPHSNNRIHWRRMFLELVLMTVLIFILLHDCTCENKEPSLKHEQAVSPSKTTTANKISIQKSFTGLIKPRLRSEYKSKPSSIRSWVTSFRMQVAARSLRLAECFEGIQRPGVIKWTSSVEPTNGVVSDHTIEPTLLSNELNSSQRTCLIDVLSDPPYQLNAKDEPATPSRVGIVIEF